jgi:hypothetical protein
MENTRPTIFRRRYMIKKKLQIHFAVAAFVLISLSTTSVWYLMDFANRAGNNAPFVLQANISVWAFILADAIGVFFLSIFFSHYVAGPVYRIERTLASLLEGEPITAVKFRKNDPMQETAVILNELITRWNELSKGKRTKK